MLGKTKGSNAERELVHKFWKNSPWSAIRVAGSGSMRYPSADILASNRVRRLAIECKTSKKGSKYVSNEDIEQLMAFSKIFGAEAWLAVKFNRKEWLFLSPDDLKNVGDSHLISIEVAEKKGLLFEEMIEKK